jgi:hypothetical protein
MRSSLMVISSSMGVGGPLGFSGIVDFALQLGDAAGVVQRRQTGATASNAEEGSLALGAPLSGPF